eukprot:6214509-Pleurochrysis_carterae.AAC.14
MLWYRGRCRAVQHVCSICTWSLDGGCYTPLLDSPSPGYYLRAETGEWLQRDGAAFQSRGVRQRSRPVHVEQSSGAIHVDVGANLSLGSGSGGGGAAVAFLHMRLLDSLFISSCWRCSKS